MPGQTAFPPFVGESQFRVLVKVPSLPQVTVQLDQVAQVAQFPSGADGMVRFQAIF